MHLLSMLYRQSAVICAMRPTLPLNLKLERARQAENWKGGMRVVTEEERASGCEDKVLVHAPPTTTPDGCKQNVTDGMSCPIFPLAIDNVGELSVGEILVGIVQIRFSSQERGTSTY